MIEEKNKLSNGFRDEHAVKKNRHSAKHGVQHIKAGHTMDCLFLETRKKTLFHSQLSNINMVFKQ